MKKANARKVSTSGPSVGDLQKQLDALSGELKEAREQQTATAEIRADGDVGWFQLLQDAAEVLFRLAIVVPERPATISWIFVMNFLSVPSPLRLAGI